MLFQSFATLLTIHLIEDHSSLRTSVCMHIEAHDTLKNDLRFTTMTFKLTDTVRKPRISKLIIPASNFTFYRRRDNFLKECFSVIWKLVFKNWQEFSFDAGL